MKAMTDGAILARLCGNVTAGRFDWRKYCTPQTYFGREVCVTPLLCSYGQIGYAVHFPYSDMPEVEYDWELNTLPSTARSGEFIYRTHDNGQIGLWHRVFIPNGNMSSLRTQGVMSRENTGISRRRSSVKYPNMPKPWMRRS